MRNYLYPKGIAVYATDENVANFGSENAAVASVRVHTLIFVVVGWPARLDHRHPFTRTGAATTPFRATKIAF